MRITTAAVLLVSLAVPGCAAGPVAPSPPAPSPPAPSVPIESAAPASSVGGSGMPIPETPMPTATPVPTASPGPTATPGPTASPGPTATSPVDTCLRYLAAEEVAAAVGEPVAPSPATVVPAAGILECEYELASSPAPALRLIVRTDQAPAALLKEADALPRTSTLVGLGIDARYSTVAADPDLVAVRAPEAYFELRTLSGEATGRVAMADLARLILPRLPQEPASSSSISPPADPASPTTPGTGGDRTALELSDPFWDPLAQGVEAQPQLESLTDVVEVSDLIVRGRIVDIRPARTVAEPPIQFVLTTVAVDEVLKGVPETRGEGAIDIEWWLDSGTELADLRSRIREHEALFFLFNQGLIAERNGHPEDMEQYRYQYTEINGAQGTLRDVAGTVRSIYQDGSDRFPASFDGGPYTDLLARVREAVAD